MLDPVVDIWSHPSDKTSRETQMRIGMHVLTPATTYTFNILRMYSIHEDPKNESLKMSHYLE